MKLIRLACSVLVLALAVAGCDAANITAADGPGNYCNPDLPTMGSGC